MSVFKQFLSSDIIITPFPVNKEFTFYGASELTASNVAIDRFIGKNITGSNFNLSDPTTGQFYTSSYQRLVYNGIKQLYYTNFISSSVGDEAFRTIIDNGVILSASIHQPQYENYLQSTLTPNRYFPSGSGDEIGVISIPSRLFGEQVKPKTFVVNSSLGSILDDGEGNILFSQDPYVDPEYVDDYYFANISNAKVGNIIYSHGLAIITKDNISGSVGIINAFTTGSNVTMSFNSTYTIHETQYKCTVSEAEFNFSLNPSLLSGSNNDTIYDFATGSFFAPYFTTVGLYNDRQELLMVAKLSKPLLSSRTTDVNLIINLDK